MKTALIVFTDGRQSCLEQTLRSFDAEVSFGSFYQRVIVNDCPDPTFGVWLDGFVGQVGFEVIPPLRNRRGFGGAIRAGWEAVDRDVDFVFHLEDDFRFTRPVDVDGMVAALVAHPFLAQMALRRQAWNQQEIEAGGVVECDPAAYTDVQWDGLSWLEHRLFFTTNPSLYHRDLLKHGWPDGKQSEGKFTHRLLRDPNLRFAYWGARTDPPWVEHIGEHRTGVGY